MAEAPLFFLIAGEESGDVLGARLMQALKAQTGGQAQFAGVGGRRMQAEGLEPLFPQSELAHMGLVEVLLHLPRLLRRIRQTAGEVQRRQPAVLITIDSPDFCFRVAQKVRATNPRFPLIHYVAPSVWAWRPGRAKKIARFLDHLLTLLPFEPPYFTRENLPCTFVGHSLIESAAGKGDAARFRRCHDLPPDALLLAVLPGSRIGEIKRLLPVFGETVAKLHALYPKLRVVVPTVGAVAARVREETSRWPTPVIVTEDDEDKYDALAAARAALACSGTISVELALARAPSVIAYKVNAFTAALLRRLLKVRYATIINILNDKMIMPEFLQERCEPNLLSEAVASLLADTETRRRQVADLAGFAAALAPEGGLPSVCAAQTVLRVIGERQRAC